MQCRPILESLQTTPALTELSVQQHLVRQALLEFAVWSGIVSTSQELGRSEWKVRSPWTHLGGAILVAESEAPLGTQSPGKACSAPLRSSEPVRWQRGVRRW